jgi:hypothetical protein
VRQPANLKLEHENNEMMRTYAIGPIQNVTS